MRFITPDKRVVDTIKISYPGSGETAGVKFRIRDIHGHWLGTARTEAELIEKLGCDLADLEIIG